MQLHACHYLARKLEESHETRRELIAKAVKATVAMTNSTRKDLGASLRALLEPCTWTHVAPWHGLSE